MGGGGGGKTQQTYTVENRDPWVQAQPYIIEGMSEAKKVFDQQKATGPYTGDFVAQTDPRILNGAIGGMDWSTGAGMNGLNAGMNYGLGAAGAGQTGMGNALAGLFGQASTDPTQANIAAAGQYANSPFADGMIDGATRDIRRNLSEVALPGIDRMAAGTGNTNSTRAGAAEGVAMRGAADQIGDISAQIRGGLFDRGLDMAQSDRALQNQAYSQAGQLAGNYFNSGMGGIDSAFNNANTNATAQAINGGTIQQNTQNALDNNIAKADYLETRAWSPLMNYWQIANGGGQLGGTSTSFSNSKTKEQASTMGTIGSGLALFGSLMKCDIRCKWDIAATGETFHGFRTYTFKYIGDDTPIEGVMAQDVEKTRPDCVHEIDGVKHVDVLKIALTEAA